MRLPTLIVVAAALLLAQNKDLGLFTDHGPVGATPPGGNVAYNPAKGEYRITGGGANLWDKVDAFHYVWKKVSGEFTLGADIQWVGAGANAHRKALLMVRQSLDPGSSYADAAFHGDGLTSLQFRGAANEQTYEIATNVDGPVRLRLVRKGGRFTMLAGKPDGELKAFGPIGIVSLRDPVYVGLGVCSHEANKLETALFTNVTVVGAK